MANKKQIDSKNEQVKKNSTSTKKNNSKTNSVSKTNKTTKKNNSTKKATSTSTKNSNVKKVTTKETKVVKKIDDIKVNDVELANVLEKEEVIKPIKTKKRNKKLLCLGIFIVILGIVALFVSLIANRIVDREFLNDNAITFMIISSIIIEGFGSFIIINEA